MYAQTVLPIFDSAVPAGMSEAYGRSSYVDPASVSQPRFVRSVVEDAGLGSFAYLRGASGKRYVFSAVRGNQISLYQNAVFAVAGTDGSLERIVPRAEIGSHRLCSQLYVHLLDEDDADVSEAIADMTGSVS